MLVWPKPAEVDAAVRRWAATITATRQHVTRIGYFGSYARGDWGVGSDVDIVAIVATANKPFDHRPMDWDLTSLPVPADLVVYTEDEWRNLMARGGRFRDTLARETVWVSP